MLNFIPVLESETKGTHGIPEQSRDLIREHGKRMTARVLAVDVVNTLPRSDREITGAERTLANDQGTLI